MYTAHVAPATFSDKGRWFIKRDRLDPNKIVYVSDKKRRGFLGGPYTKTRYY